MAQWQAYLEQHRQEYLEDLIAFLRIPSVSTEPAHKEDVRRAAQWTAERIFRAGIHEVHVMETGMHPIVFAEHMVSPDQPTVLFYGHFDVQPVEPLALWTHPPFEPHVQDGKIFARAASDMKGNVLLPIIACEALLATTGSLPFNVKFMIEGEEEIGSPSLETFISQHRAMLSCDLAISADGGIGTAKSPRIGLSTRGLAGLQVRVQTANVDIHSGMGGFAPNALHALITILDSLRDAAGRILVEGFYDDVLPIADADLDTIEGMVPGMERLAGAWGIETSFGEPDYAPVARALARPTLEVNGMWGGFQGEGVKTVIPHEAFAKLTCRLVRNQDPVKVRALVRTHIERVAPSYAHVTVEDLPGSAFPYRLPSDHMAVQTLQRVLEQTTGQAPTFAFGGGTVPVMGMLQQVLGVETITIGASGEGERAHAPDEFLRLDNFERLQDLYCRYLIALAASIG